MPEDQDPGQDPTTHNPPPTEPTAALSERITALESLIADKDAAQAQAAATTAAEREALEQQLAEAQAQAQTARDQVAQAHRRVVLAENRGQLVEELVHGSTPEEIDASVEVARAAYARIVEVQRAQAAAMVPAGASSRSEPAPEELSPLAKITSALTRNGR